MIEDENRLKLKNIKRRISLLQKEYSTCKNDVAYVLSDIILDLINLLEKKMKLINLLEQEIRRNKMTLIELKEEVDAAIEHAIEGLYNPEEVAVSIQVDTFGKSDVICTDNVEAHYDNDACASGFVLLGTKGYTDDI